MGWQSQWPVLFKEQKKITWSHGNLVPRFSLLPVVLSRSVRENPWNEVEVMRIHWAVRRGRNRNIFFIRNFLFESTLIMFLIFWKFQTVLPNPLLINHFFHPMAPNPTQKMKATTFEPPLICLIWIWIPAKTFTRWVERYFNAKFFGSCLL